MTLKFGATMNFYQKSENNGGNNVGSLSTTSTNRPSTTTPTYMQQWANFLQGYISSFSQASLDVTPDIRVRQFEAYAQNDWRVRRNLTLNLGVRYSNFRQPVDAKHMLTNFNPAFYKAADAPALTATGSGLVAGTVFNPSNGLIVNTPATCPVANGCLGTVNPNSPYGNAVAPQANLNFAPRLGIAWDPFGKGKTKISTGYGMFYDSILVGIYEQNIFANAPFVSSPSWSNVTLQNLTGGTPAALALRNIRATPMTGDIPYSQQWTFGIQHEIVKNTKVEVAYVGSKGTHLLGRIELNTLPAGYAMKMGVQQPGQQFTSTTSPILNTLRPYKGYVGVDTIQTWFDSSYNSLQVHLDKRLSGGSSVMVAYTWSKNMTDAGSDRSHAPMDPYNRKLERSVAAADRTHILNFTYVYHLPFFRLQRGFFGKALGGWELTGNTAINSGLPSTAATSIGTDPAGLGIIAPPSTVPRPLQICDPNKGAPHTQAQWFNTSCFMDIPAGVNMVGNAGRFTIRGPGFQTWNVSIYKNFKLNERMKLQFRGETVNFPNHTNFSGISVTTTSASYGQVSSARTPRTVQVGLKVLF